MLYIVISVSAESTTVKTALISGELGGRSAQLGQLHRVLSTITASFWQRLGLSSPHDGKRSSITF